MTLDWQFLVTLLLVAAAAGFLAWRGWRAFRRKRCGKGCGGCAPPEGKEVVELSEAFDASLTTRR